MCRAGTLMASMTTLSAGLAWATPVRPDLLGKHLQAYHDILPNLEALRLCRRFGKGARAYGGSRVAVFSS